MPEDNECCACLSVISLDSIVHVDEKYYPHKFLEKCIYAIKKKKMINAIDEELRLDEFDSESDNEFIKKIKIVF